MTTSRSAWTCAACGRQVPRRIRQCRCGAEPPELWGAQEEPTADSPSRSRLLVGLTALLAVGLSAAAYLSRPAANESDRVAGNTVESTEEAAPKQAPEPAAARPAPARSAEAAPRLVPI